MDFITVTPDENYPVLRKLSSSGRWELGYCQYLFGRRLRLGEVGKRSVLLDYCAGPDIQFQNKLLATIEAILKHIPENSDSLDIEELFPPYTIKPIINDPVCWPALQQLARNEEQRE